MAQSNTAFQIFSDREAGRCSAAWVDLRNGDFADPCQARVAPAPQETFRSCYILGGSTAHSLLLKLDLWQGQKAQGSSPGGMMKGHVSSLRVRPWG